MKKVSVTILYLKKLIIISTTNNGLLVLLLLLLNFCDLIGTDNQNYDVIDDNVQVLSGNKAPIIIDKVEPSPSKARKKRFVWVKNRKLIFPLGSVLTLTPELQLPFLRQPPEGLNSDIKISWVFYMFFDKLGMTDENHPWPPSWSWPPFYPFSDLFRILRRQQSLTWTNKKRRIERSVLSMPPPERIHGGERAIIIPQLEKMLTSMGIVDDSRSCLLRAICEIHESPLHEQGFGLLGEVLTLIFTVSLSPYADSHLTEYVKAEEAGKAGDCGHYIKRCAKSMFVCGDDDEKENKYHKYSKEMQNIRHSQNIDNNNEILD